MPDTAALRRRRNLAYWCFLLIGGTAILGSLASLLPVDPGVFGFLVLLPLTLASVIALAAVTIFTAMVGRADSVLIGLLAATVAVIGVAIAAFSEGMPLSIEGWVVSILIIAYGLAAVSISIHWFAVRRDR